MKTLFATLLICLMAVPAMAGDADLAAHHPDPSNLHIRIMRPTPHPVIWVRHPYLYVSGHVGPTDLLEKVTYSTSAGESGDCVLKEIKPPSNVVAKVRPNLFIFVTPKLSLDPGTNLINVVAVPNDPQLEPVSDTLLVKYNAVTNHRPRIISRPRRWWGTNDTYTYTLRAVDRDDDPLRLKLDTRGPVVAHATRIENGVWHIAARLTTTVMPRRVAFRAIVTDGLTRPAQQRWSVWCRNCWRKAIRRRKAKRNAQD
jgi:hypothetical protein